MSRNTLSRCTRRSTPIILGCDNDACLKWINVTRHILFKTTVGDFVEISGLEFKQLKDGTETSRPEKFRHLALCSKSMPAMAYESGGKIIVDWLSPDSTDGVFGYNQTDYPSYLEACHSKYGKDIQNLAKGLGYAVDPQFVNQERFRDLSMFGEAIGNEGGKRNVDASLIGTCSISVGGRKYTDGRCRISITSLEDAKTIVITDVLNDYFAYINIDNAHNNADGYWNSEQKWSKAEASLGSLTLKGDCWTNTQAELCYRWR